MTRDRRLLRDQPYLDEHASSRSARNRPPASFSALLHWFLLGFIAETPETIHAAGVWFGRPARIDGRGRPVDIIPTELVGGSQLGSPKEAEPFRQLLENSARQIAGDGADEHYVRPMRAALAWLSTRDDGPFMARFLVQVAYAQGDWRSVGTRWFPAQPFVTRPFTEQALRRLYGCFRDEPPARRIRRADERPGWVDMSESQRQAIEAGEEGAVA